MESISGTGTGRRRVNGEDRKVEGRKGKDQQEAVIETKVVKDKINYLVKLKNAADEAGEDYSEGIKKVAEDSGILASELRKFVNARAGENFEEAKRRCEQLALLFEEVGEA
jgi:hypothetical protein